MMRQVTEQDFRTMLEPRLSTDQFGRGLRLFQDCPALAFDITNVLMHAGDQGKADEVLNLLEAHYTEHMQYQHPDIRGTVNGAFGNPTANLLLTICRDTLGLEARS